MQKQLFAKNVFEVRDTYTYLSRGNKKYYFSLTIITFERSNFIEKLAPNFYKKTSHVLRPLLRVLL